MIYNREKERVRLWNSLSKTLCNKPTYWYGHTPVVMQLCDLLLEQIEADMLDPDDESKEIIRRLKGTKTGTTSYTVSVPSSVAGDTIQISWVRDNDNEYEEAPKYII